MAQVTVSGPLFDGRGHAVLDAMCDSIAYEVAREGQAVVLVNSHASLKTQTPYYTTKIEVTDAGLHAQDVDDSGVIYGPWLEGVGSRNFPRTRFKGYAMFRRATQYLNLGTAQTIADRIAHTFARRMG